MGSCEGETERDRKRTGGRETRGMIERGKGQRRGKRERERVASAKEKSLKKSENKREGACLMPRWPCYWRRQELLINAKKV